MPNPYDPEDIQERALPGQAIQNNEYPFNSRQKTSRDIYRPRTILDQPFPYKVIANEVVGQSLNTMSGQFYTSFNFTQPTTKSQDASNVRYWIGGSGNWSDRSNWAYLSGGANGAELPDENTDVIFDADSFTASGQSLVMDVDAKVKDFDWSNATNSPDLDISGNNTLEIYGDLRLNSSMTITGPGSVPITSRFELYSDPGKINYHDFAGISIPQNILFSSSSGITGIHSLLSDLEAQIVLINNCVFNSNGFDIATNQDTDSSQYAGFTIEQATINMSSGTWSLTGDNLNFTLSGTDLITINPGTASLVYNCESIVGTAAALTINNGASTVTNLPAITVNGDVVGGDLIAFYNNVSNGVITIPSLIFTGFEGSFVEFNVSGNGDHIYQINGLTLNGTALNSVNLTGPVGEGSLISKSSGTVTVNYCNITNSQVGGGATWNAVNSTDSGGNTGWNFI